MEVFTLTNAFSRFRETGSSFSDTVPAGTVLGKLKRFNSQGVLVSSVDKTSGSGKFTYEYKRTWDQKNPGPPYRSGGPFSSVKVRVENGYKNLGILSTKGYSVPGLPAGDYFEYSGNFFNPIFVGDTITSSQYGMVGGAPPFDRTFLPEPRSYGPVVWKKLQPQIPRAGLGQFLVEFREFPKMLKQTAAGFHDAWKVIGGRASPGRQPRKLADQFLNIQFGWKPFINDMYQLVDTWHNSRKYIDQIVKDNGMWVRRRRTIEDSRTSVKIAENFFSLGCEPNLTEVCTPLNIKGTWTSGCWSDTYREDITSVWAEGAFMYYRPEFDRSLETFDSRLSDLQRLLKLYGADINPSLVYNVTPWTWLIDWFTGLGDNIDAASAIGLDGVVCKYLYIMQHTYRIIRHVCHLNLYSGERQLNWFRVIESKQRASADGPYGFTLPSSLSGTQLAILAALGMPKSF